ncbi:MAG: phenylalanine--tRNA ligase subunit beta, partial [Anaerolineales bacterium]
DLPPQRTNASLEREETVRDLLARAGLREVITYRLTTPEAEAALVPSGSESDWAIREYVALANPITSDKTVMRQTLLAGLLGVAANNARYQARQAIFEIGSVYLPVPGEALPAEPRRLSMLMMGQRHLPDWQTGKGQAEMLDYFDLKGVIEHLLDGLRLPDAAITIEPTTHSTFWPGRVARLRLGDKDLGVFGQIHPLVPEHYGLERDLDTPVLAAELHLESLLDFMRTMYPITPIHNQPAVYQDMAIVVSHDKPAAEVEAAIWAAGGDLLVGVRLFDVYTGEQIPENKKSLAYALTYQHPEETLTDKRVAKVHSKIAKALEKQLGAQLRA